MYGAASQASPVSWKLVDSIRIIENQGGRDGDGGRARGEWQFWEIAWRDVSLNYRKERGLKVYSYAYARNHGIARMYARDFLNLLSKRFKDEKNRYPTVKELWACWNVGLNDFLNKYRGSLSRCPASTRRNAVRIQGMVDNNKK